MLKRAQFPFPVPLPKPVGARQSFYWVAFSACLAASWADARAKAAPFADLAIEREEQRDRFLEVAVEHLQMRAQAEAVGLDEDEGPVHFARMPSGKPS